MGPLHDTEKVSALFIQTRVIWALIFLHSLPALAAGAGSVNAQKTTSPALNIGIKSASGNESTSATPPLLDISRKSSLRNQSASAAPPLGHSSGKTSSENTSTSGDARAEVFRKLHKASESSNRTVGITSNATSTSQRKGPQLQRLTAFPVHEVRELPKGFPVTVPNFNDSQWSQFHVKGTPRMITVCSAECNEYFDWQTLGLYYSFKRSGQPGRFLRLLACSEKDLLTYKGMDIAPTLVAPNWNINPRTGDLYPAINKPVGVAHWLAHGGDTLDVDWVLILDADQILRAPIIPWELGAERGRVVSAPYTYLIGCDNILSELHMKKHMDTCDKVGGFIGMHIEDLRAFVPWWINKTEEVRADKAHYATNITGDVYGQGWISEMYGYSFGASEAGLKHLVKDEVMLYPGYIPMQDIDPKLFHYGLGVRVGGWSWRKWDWRSGIVYQCGSHFPDPPQVASLPKNATALERRRDLISFELVAVLNRALRAYHRHLGCALEQEKDIGPMDLNGAGIAPSGAIWVDVWRGVAEAWSSKGGGKQMRGGRGWSAVPSKRKAWMGRKAGSGLLERGDAAEEDEMREGRDGLKGRVRGLEKGLYVERVVETGVRKKKEGRALIGHRDYQNKGDTLSGGHQGNDTEGARGGTSPKVSTGGTEIKTEQRYVGDDETGHLNITKDGRILATSKPDPKQALLQKEKERRRGFTQSSTAEKLFLNFTVAAESAHLNMMLGFSIGLLVGMVFLVLFSRVFHSQKYKRKERRLKRESTRKAKLLSM